MSNVINLNEAKAKTRLLTALKVAEQPAQPRLAEIELQNDWKAALAAIWANPKNWKRSKKGLAYIEISDLGVCVVILRDQGGFRWEIRWRDGSDPITSKWIHMSETLSVDDAWDAICVLG